MVALAFLKACSRPYYHIPNFIHISKYRTRALKDKGYETEQHSNEKNSNVDARFEVSNQEVKLFPMPRVLWWTMEDGSLDSRNWLVRESYAEILRSLETSIYVNLGML